MNRENNAYQALWEKYIKANRDMPYVFLPLEIGMTEDGEFYRTRMTASAVAKIRDGIIDKFPKYMDSNPLEFGVPDQIFGNYIKYFEKHDGADMSAPRTPFDLNIIHPTWLMFSLGNLNWKFTQKGEPFSTENDPNSFVKNFVQVGLFDDPRLPKTEQHGQPLNARKLLILANRNRSAPKDLKYNLNVDVLQTVAGEDNSTMIMIDPGSNNTPMPPYGGPLGG